MDVMNLVGVIFRLGSIIMGVILAYLVYDIYKLTKGGSKGWLELAICFVSLGVWAVFQMIFFLIFNNYFLRVISGIILFFAMAITIFLAPTSFIRDMKLKTKWLTRKNVYILIFSVFTLSIIYNFILTPPQGYLPKLLSINVNLLIISFLLASYSFYVMYKQIKVKLWLYLGMSCLIAGLGMSLVSVAFTNCCAPGLPLHGKEICSSWIYDYVPVLPTPCIESLIPLTSNGTGFVGIAEFIGILVFYKMRKIFS